MSAEPKPDPKDTGTPAPQPSQPPRAAPLPERPKLAPDVKLVGQMKESAFKDPPWMVERSDGTFIQVTPLLFQIAERCNGQNTIDEIASQITEAGTPVQAQTVGRLIGQILIRQGIILTADGTVVKLQKHARSPLTLSMRMKMLSPEVIEPVTGILRLLYWPPLLVALLLAAGVAQWWVFFEHGIAGPIHDALYRPASMLVLLGIVVASAAFHEFGHAAGLRYGGGKVRGMGVGLYLIYPVVYTDVTDEYRLGRAARVRTDLGGFYFNMIFALAILGIYFLTRQPFLLVSVLLTDLEIFQQIMPFTRFDGYWILADLTGIPDFFANLIPFIRTELHLSGPHVPPLKNWARVVFAAYILVTAPMLALIVFLMVKSVPRVLVTAWASGGHQLHSFSTAASSGHIDGMALAAVAVVGLSIPTLGLCIALYRFAKQGFRALWRWSAGSRPRRAVASLTSMGVIAGVILLWLPEIPVIHTRGPLYSAEAFRPIAANERGTLHDAVPIVPGSSAARAPIPTRIPARTPTTPAPTPPPTSGRAGVTTGGSSPTAKATPVATQQPTAAATAIPTVASTPEPTVESTTAFSDTSIATALPTEDTTDTETQSTQQP